MKTGSWYFDEGCSSTFHTLNSTLRLEGEQITSSPVSYVLKANIEGGVFYIKVYTRAGKYLRRFLGRSRVRGEWENLLFFQSLGIPTAKIVAYGETRQWGFFKHGILVTQEVPDSSDLAQLTTRSHYLNQRGLRRGLIKRVANIARQLHGAGFVHNDLKWRNILINGGLSPEIFLIDCPVGSRKRGPFLKRGKIKDLACLDKVGKKMLSRTDRLRFYQCYRACNHLEAADKRQIRKIVSYFSGRE